MANEKPYEKDNAWDKVPNFTQRYRWYNLIHFVIIFSSCFTDPQLHEAGYLVTDTRV